MDKFTYILHMLVILASWHAAISLELSDGPILFGRGNIVTWSLRPHSVKILF